MSDGESEAEESMARAEQMLGEPEAIYRASPGRQRAKLAVAIGLLSLSLAGIIGWLIFGPRRPDHFLFHLLFLPGTIGGSLLLHMYRHRGVRVLLYPSGLLKLQRGSAESFPWDEIADMRLQLKVKKEIHFERDGGRIVNAWFETGAPVFQVWAVWVQLIRQDGASVQISAALADFPDLARRVQRRLFPILDERARPLLESDETLPFGRWEVSCKGVTQKKVFIPWREMTSFGLTAKLVIIKRGGFWKSGIAAAMAEIPNLPLLCAIAARKGVPIKEAVTSSPEPDQ